MINRQVITVLRRLILPHWSRTLALLLSMSLGVASVLSIECLINSAQQSIRDQARDLLGADLVLSAWRPLDDPWSLDTRQRLELQGRTAEIIELATMTQLSHEIHAIPRLTSLKGVSHQYPLHGRLRISSINQDGSLLPPQVAVGQDLDDGGVWVAQTIWNRVTTTARDSTRYTLSIAGHPFPILGVIKDEPDGGFAGALSFAPRVMIHQEQLQELGLISFGSRVRRKLLFAYHQSRSTEDLISFTESLAKDVPDHIRVQNYLNGQQNISTLLERVGLFFSMVTLVALVLCLLAFMSGVWGLINDLLPQLATARSLGVKAQSFSYAYALFISLITLLGSVLGYTISTLVTTQLAGPLSNLIGIEIDIITSSTAIFQVIAIALVVSLLVNYMIQRSLARLGVQNLWSGHKEGLHLKTFEVLTIVSLALIAIIYDIQSSSGSLILALSFAGVLLSIGILAAVISFSWFKGLKSLLRYTQHLKWPSGLLFALRQMLGMQRRVWVAIMSMGLSFSLMGGLELISKSLIEALRVDDETAPQIFMIDVQDDQRQLVHSIFESYNLSSPELRPLIRARIASINQQIITQALVEGKTPAERLRGRSLTREFNLTTQEQPSITESVVEGQWWSSEHANLPSTQEVSVEVRFAQRMGFKLGDRISFDIQGRQLAFTISSFRRVNWLSFAPNFIFVLPPGPLLGAPRTLISAAQLKEEKNFEQLSLSLYQHAPNISLIDLRPILKEGRSLLLTLKQALQVTAMICALAGLLLMIHIIRRDRARRAQSVHLLSALGVGTRKAWQWVTLELGLLGMGAGFTVLGGMLFSAWMGCYLLKIPLELPMGSLLFWVGSSTVLPLIISIFPSFGQSSST